MILMAEVVGADNEKASLSELETKLYERFQTEKEIDLAHLDAREKGALGKLFSKKLIEKTQIEERITSRGGIKMKAVWKLKEEE